MTDDLRKRIEAWKVDKGLNRKTAETFTLCGDLIAALEAAEKRPDVASLVDRHFRLPSQDDATHADVLREWARQLADDGKGLTAAFLCELAAAMEGESR